MQRRLMLSSLLLAGCAADPADPAPPRDPHALLSPWRTVTGGFIAPPQASTGMLARAGSAMFVKWVAPAAIALRGTDLLVADPGTGRLWRADVLAGTVAGLPAAPLGPGTALALGADLSAWVLDPPVRQVLRFARDGRLLQTFRAPAAANPRSMALANGGQVLLLADGPLGQWSELRLAGATAVPVRLEGGERMPQVDGIAVSRCGVFVLDTLAGQVLRAQRDGRVLATLGHGALKRPVAIAVDRHERIFVLEADARTVHVLHEGWPTQVLTVAQLGVAQIGGLAIDEHLLAVSDRLAGQVVIHQLGAPA